MRNFIKFCEPCRKSFFGGREFEELTIGGPIDRLEECDLCGEKGKDLHTVSKGMILWMRENQVKKVSLTRGVHGTQHFEYQGEVEMSVGGSKLWFLNIDDRPQIDELGFTSGKFNANIVLDRKEKQS